LQQWDRIGWGNLNPVDLASAQGRQTCRGFWHGEQHDLVDFRKAVFIPVLLVRFVLSALTRHEAGHLERASARRVGSKGTPVLADLVPLRWAAVEDVDELEEHKTRRLRGDELDGVGVDFLIALDGREAWCHLPGLLRIVLRRLLVAELIPIPDYRVGVKLAAIMTFDPMTQLEDPTVHIVLIHFPRLCQGRCNIRQALPLRQVPAHQGIVQLIPDKAIALKALIRYTSGISNISRGHADTQSSP